MTQNWRNSFSLDIPYVGEKMINIETQTMANGKIFQITDVMGHIQRVVFNTMDAQIRAALIELG